jgi:nicotinate-nucleotide adenylyltransferase
MTRLGIFGGSFDPPHIGHLILAAEALAQLRLSKVLWVVTPDPPHKRGQRLTPLELRLEMVRAAIEDNPAFEISRVEIDRPGPQYAYETVRLLAEQYPGADLVYLIGGDSLRDLPTWRDPQALLAGVAALGVLRRPRSRIDLDRLEAQIPGLSAKVEFIDAPQLEISSSQVRRRAAGGGPFRYYLPEKVYRIICEHHLYR